MQLLQTAYMVKRRVSQNHLTGKGIKTFGEQWSTDARCLRTSLINRGCIGFEPKKCFPQTTRYQVHVVSRTYCLLPCIYSDKIMATENSMGAENEKEYHFLLCPHLRTYCYN
jgi:hypothetical protein